MVILLKFFLVFYGFFVAFYSAIFDLFSTFLPERTIKSGLLVALLGWSLVSFLEGKNYLLISLFCAFFFFILGYLIYRLHLWASGDFWYLASVSALLAPAFPHFYPNFFLYLFISTFFWAFSVFVFMSIKFGFWIKVIPFILASIFFLPSNFSLSSVLILAAILLSAKDVERASIFEKTAKEIEEEDFVEEEVDLGFMPLEKGPISRYEAMLVREFAKGKRIKVRKGYPLTPAFALAYLLLDFNPQFTFLLPL